MKIITTLIAFIAGSLTIHAQVTNIKAGNWSDNSIWSSSLVPTAEDDVELNFDMVIDVNAVCLSFNSNGHQVLVNTGKNLSITGNNADTLLAAYLELLPTAPGAADTFSITHFTYDSLKRNTGIDIWGYLDVGVLSYQYHADFYYLSNSRFPFKKVLTTVYAADPSDVVNNTHIFSWQNGQMIADSVPGAPYGAVTNFTYSADSIIAISKIYQPGGFITDRQSAAVIYQNGNIVRQLGPQTYPFVWDHVFVFDSHSNPFYYTHYKLLFSYTYPFYNGETFIPEVFASNNATSIHETNSGSGYDFAGAYEYRPNGYPKAVFDPSSGKSGGYGAYFYTH